MVYSAALDVYWYALDCFRVPWPLKLTTLLLHIFHRNAVRPFFTSDLGDALGGNYSNAVTLANEDPTMLVSKLNKTVGYLGALAKVNGDSVLSAYETTKPILISVQLRDPISISGKQRLVVLKTRFR